jgi:hypothetical protein
MMREQLPDRDALFSLLGEFRPVRADTFVVVQPAPRVRDGERHGSEPFRRRMDDYHRVFVPRLTGMLVPDPAPEIDHLLAVAIYSTRSTSLMSSRKVVRKGIAHCVEPWRDLPLYDRVDALSHQRSREYRDPQHHGSDADALPDAHPRRRQVCL